MATCDPDIVIDHLFGNQTPPGGRAGMKRGMEAIIALGQKKTELKAEILEKSIEYTNASVLKSSTEVDNTSQKFLDEKFDSPTAEELSSHPRTSDTDTILHSGGALESDTVWGQIATKLKMIVNHYYVKEKGSYSKASPKPPNANAPITEAEYKLGINMATSAGRAIGKLDGGSTTRSTLNIRNAMQVQYSDAVLAVGEKFIDKDEPLDKHGHVALKKSVAGGTGLAVEMGIQKGIPVYVLMETKDGPTWYEAKNDDFVAMDTEPDLSQFNSVTGIGTRAKNTGGLSAGIKAKMSSVLTNMQTKKNMNKLDSKKQSVITSILSGHSGSSLKNSSTVSDTHLVTGSVHDNGSAFVSAMSEMKDYEGFDINHNFGNPFVMDTTTDGSYAFSILNETSSIIDSKEKIDVTIAYYNWLKTGAVPDGYSGDRTKLAERREWAVSRLSKLNLFLSIKGNTIGSMGASANNIEYGLSDNMVLETIMQENHKSAIPKSGGNSNLFNDPLFKSGDDIDEFSDAVTIVDTAGKKMSILSNSKGVVLKKGSPAKKGYYDKKTKKKIPGKKGTRTTYKKIYEGVDKDGKKKMFDTVARAYSSQIKGKNVEERKAILEKLVKIRISKDTAFKKELLATEGKVILYPADKDASDYVKAFRKGYVDILENARDEIINKDGNKDLPKKNAKFGGRPTGHESITPSGNTIVDVARSIMNKFKNGVKYIVEWNQDVEDILKKSTDKQLDEIFEEALTSNNVVMDKKYEDILSDTHDRLDKKHKDNREKAETKKKADAKAKKLKDAKDKFSKPKQIGSKHKIHMDHHEKGMPDFVNQITGITKYYEKDSKELAALVTDMVRKRIGESETFKKSLIATGSGKLSHGVSKKLNSTVAKYTKSVDLRKKNYTKVASAYISALTTVRTELLNKLAEDVETKKKEIADADSAPFDVDEVNEARSALDPAIQKELDESKEC